MDTRDLSPNTYKAIIQEAADAHKDLALQFGMLAKLSASEADYISKAQQLIALMQGYNDEEVDAIFVENPLSPAGFKGTLSNISNNISNLHT